ncbi:MAG TPA: SRPBCC domain-containing protein [Candidatus Limnocylindrales bacterium]|nr:SRPBCC domain-containing protein [Candidatus Limnocylindrales bacterium]
MNDIEKRFAQGRLFPFAPSATIDIDAPAERVWAVLTDFEHYGEWNRFTPNVECSGRIGDEVVLQVCFPGRKPMRQIETLNVFEPPHRLAWGMHMLAPTLLVANRYQTVEALGAARTRYTSIDYLSGLLAPLVRALYAAHMEAGFRLAAEGLKHRSERQ